ncbi:MAG: hypothetical protein MN733_20840 [Nitrososphaera sp.]|nr:hypothetical protein [Nitrososphaera sp.]
MDEHDLIEHRQGPFGKLRGHPMAALKQDTRSSIMYALLVRTLTKKASGEL